MSVIETVSSLPKMMVDEKAYAAMLERGFARFPRRRENHQRALAAKRGEVVDYLPEVIYVEPVARCNFRCIMCDLQGLPDRKRGEDLTFEDFKTVFQSMEGVVQAKMNGTGENLLHKQIFDMLEIVAGADVWIQMSTNASLMHHRDAHRRLIDLVGELQISIDGATRETFEAIRIGAQFDKVTENARLANEYAASKGGAPNTRSLTVLQRDNRHELADMVRLAADLGFKRQTFSVALIDSGNAGIAKVIEELRDYPPLTLTDGWALVELGERLGVEVSFIDHHSLYTRKNICPYPFDRTFVASTGRLAPCCKVNPMFCDLGDARDFAATWNGPVYREFRKAHIDGNIPPVCQACYDLS